MGPPHTSPPWVAGEVRADTTPRAPRCHCWAPATPPRPAAAEPSSAAAHLGGCPQLKVDHVVGGKVLQHLLGDAGDAAVVGGDGMDDIKQPETLGQRAGGCSCGGRRCQQVLTVRYGCTALAGAAPSIRQ